MRQELVTVLNESQALLRELRDSPRARLLLDIPDLEDSDEAT